MLRSIGKQSGESAESETGETEGYGGKDLHKEKVLIVECKGEWVMDDESGESMEPMEEVPVRQLGESELERLVP